MFLVSVATNASGRFDALVAIAQGSNVLFSCLTRHVEGRALRGVGPPSEVVPASSGDATMVSTLLSGLVAEAQWPSDVRVHVLPIAVQISFLELINSYLSFYLALMLWWLSSRRSSSWVCAMTRLPAAIVS